MRTTDAAVKLAAIKAVKDAVAAAETDAKAYLTGAMDPGDRKNAVLGEESVGTVSYSKTSAKAVVNDRAAFTSWATDAHPEEVRVEVTLDADDVLAALLFRTGQVLDDDHAAAYDRVMAAVRDTPAKVRPAFEAKVLADCVKAKSATDLSTGEVIPGVAYVPGGQAGYVSIRQSEEQRAALVAHYQDGRLGDLLDLATMPIAAIEAAS
jgi:hypothetical protein